MKDAEVKDVVRYRLMMEEWKIMTEVLGLKALRPEQAPDLGHYACNDPLVLSIIT